jgi:hypothetical protein
MNKLIPTQSSFGVYMIWPVLLAGILVFFTNGINGLFLSPAAFGQEKYIAINVTDLINKGKYLNNIGTYSESIV